MSGAAASLLPGGDAKPIGADRFDDVLQNVSQVASVGTLQIIGDEVPRARLGLRLS